LPWCHQALAKAVISIRELTAPGIEIAAAAAEQYHHEHDN
jgi:hypothetical protein